ncbi:MAG: FHA domain-containing protein [Prevotella sp.]|nr:FHA domain-containing protein [Prevotella sp.]
MKRLRGKTILIGKEPQSGRLMISMNVNGTLKKMVIPNFNNVPNTVSRCMPENNMAHCKIEIDANGKMKVHNLKSQNVTFVNGMEIETRTLKSDDKLELGADRYPIPLDTIFTAGIQMIDGGGGGKPPVKEYSIKPLERVWNNYHKETMKIKREQKNLAAAQGLAPMLTIGGSVISAILAKAGDDWVLEIMGSIITPAELCWVTIPLSLLGLILMGRNYYRRKNDTSLEDQDRLLAELQTLYVCPNPDCKQFLGANAYRVIRQKKTCPYCKCKYTEE